MTPLAVIGTLALWLTFGWLAITIVCQYLSERKGYGQRWGLATGLIFPPGVLAWLVIPAKPGSDWKVIGPWGNQKFDIGAQQLQSPSAPEAPTGRQSPGGPGPTGTAG